MLVDILFRILFDDCSIYMCIIVLFIDIHKPYILAVMFVFRDQYTR